MEVSKRSHAPLYILILIMLVAYVLGHYRGDEMGYERAKKECNQKFNN